MCRSKEANARGKKMPDVPCTGDGPVCSSGKPMSFKDAQAYMNKFRQTDIPFDFPPDCCYSRARVMCDTIEKDGFGCNKLWYEGNLHPINEDGTPVTFPTPNEPVTWHYHVAPMVPVQQPDGSVQNMILDPSLSDKPLTVAEWKRRCGNNPNAITEQRVTDSKSDYPFRNPPPTKEYTVEEANKRMEAHKRSRELSKQNKHLTW